MPEQITVGVGGAARGLDVDAVLDIGPQHPSAHGALRLALTLDGDVVSRAEPLVGYMHRGAEKLFEARDYRQIVMLANRHDWLSAFANELGVVLAVERMLGLEVPVRAVWLRTLLAELNRVLSHLAFLGALPADRPVVTTAAERELLQQVLEEASGGRVHYMFNRVGGLKEDVPLGWGERVRAAVAGVRGRLSDTVGAVVLGDAELRERARGVGVLAAAVAEQYGVTGPVARASGLDLDLRRDEPYLAYDALPVRVVTRTEGDALARLECLLEQVEVSLELVDRCLDVLADLPPGPVNVRLPKVVRAPEGATYAWTENPLGVNGYYLVSRGERTPWRLKLRTASFSNVQVLREVLPGTRLADLTTVLVSTFFVTGDLDK